MEKSPVENQTWVCMVRIRDKELEKTIREGAKKHDRKITAHVVRLLRKAVRDYQD